MGMETVVAAMAVLAVIVIGSLIWISKSINASSENTSLRDELNQKRDLAAQVPLLKQTIDDLSAKTAALQDAVDDLRTGLSGKEVALAGKEKDLERQSARIAELEKVIEQNKSQQHEQIEQLKESLDGADRKIETQLDEIKELNADRSRLRANLDAQQENNLKLKTEFEEQSKKLELKLNEIMQQNLESKLKKFDETSMKSLDGLLKPFKENLDAFKKKVEDSQENSTKKFAELSKEIEQVTKAGMNISKEAESLTKALKGKKQTQGSWGEMILESVLEYSGLLKGVHYETQESYRDEEGKTKRPDVVIKLPQERTIIIDSKVSLNDYDRYIRAETDEERTLAAKGIATAFRNHIDTLDSKDYAHYKVGTLQYVFMFVPVEGAFAMAVQQDPSLYEYALQKHIAIVNPSTLTVSLRTIYLYWQSEQSSTLAGKLFDEAGKLYDKMVGFAENFNRIGNQIKTLGNTFDQANRQLTEGRGNLLGRVENLKRLGATTSKSLKSAKIEYQDFDENDVEVEVVEDDSDQPLTLEKPE